MRKEADQNCHCYEVTVPSNPSLQTLWNALKKGYNHSFFINRRKVAAVNFFELNHDLFGF